MKKNSVWSLELTMPTLLLLLAAIGINYIGKLLIQLLSLPLWLDSIGTFLACMLGGPIVGAVAGLLNNMIYGFLLDWASFFYGLTSVAMGLTVGVMARRGFLERYSGVLLMGIAAAVVAALVSTPINLSFWDGTNGNVWGDMLFHALHNSGWQVGLSSFTAELCVDLPDKLITVFLSYIMYKKTPKYITQFFATS